MQQVSVLLTTYNSQQHLQRAIDSVFNQKGLNSEFTIDLIVVDDCSTDETQKILEQNKIDYISTEINSGGPNKGRNIGLSKAKGDYILIMDHDDEWHPHRIISQLKHADKAAIITCSHVLIIDEKENRDLSKSFEYRLYDNNTTFKHKISKTKNKQSTYLGSIMFHKSLKNILFEEQFGQIDFDWVARLFHNNHSVELGESLFNRYVYGANLSLDKTYRMRDYEYSMKTLEDYQNDYPEETSKGRKRINGTLARYFYITNDMKSARRYFLKSHLNVKTFLFYLTSFVGHKFVKKKFHFFG